MLFIVNAIFEYYFRLFFFFFHFEISAPTVVNPPETTPIHFPLTQTVPKLHVLSQLLSVILDVINMISNEIITKNFIKFIKYYLNQIIIMC